MFEPLGLVPFLLSDAGVKAIAGDRVMPMATAQGKAYPRVTYERQSTDRVASNDGPSGLANARIQIIAWGEGPTGYDDAKALADAVRKARGTSTTAAPDGGRAQLDGFKGRMAGVLVKGCFLREDGDVQESPEFADDRRVYSVSMIATVWWDETYPTLT